MAILGRLFSTRRGVKRGETPLLHHLAGLTINKRQRFVLSVLLLSLGLFFSENLHLVKSGIYIALILSVLTDAFLFWSTYKDLKDNFSPYIFILPFFYSLSFSLFYFLIPDRLITRILMTSVYAIGLYSLFLSQNIFIVGSMRTIALLSSARTVSFIITLISYFFLTNTLYSLHLFVFPTATILFTYSFFLILHSMWTYLLVNGFSSYREWAIGLSLCLVEIGFILWFWPASTTFIALFLTGFFYTIVGLSHVWTERRLFRGILWEYIWVAVIVFAILVLYTFNPNT